MIHKSLVLSSLALSLLSCESKQNPAYADVGWRVRTKMGGGVASPNRVVKAFNNENETQVACAAEPTSDPDVYFVNFTVKKGEEFGLFFQGRFNKEGGTIRSEGCNVSVLEGGATYNNGACSASAPSATLPCQVNNPKFETVEGAKSFTGEIFCDGVSSSTLGTAITKKVTASGDGPSFESAPAKFVISNCRGLP